MSDQIENFELEFKLDSNQNTEYGVEANIFTQNELKVFIESKSNFDNETNEEIEGPSQ